MAKQRIIRYCKVCQQKVEDTTKGNNKIICSEKCREKYDKDYMKKYNAAYRKIHVKEYKEYLIKKKLARKKIPKWNCEFCRWELQLDFDPLLRQNIKKLQDLKCQVCEEQKTPN